MDISRSRGADVVALVAPSVVGFLGTVPTVPALREWYPSLEKPSWNPPNAVFGPVWTTLYALMGIALVQVRRADEPTGRAQSVFGLQLALNLAWSFVFFGNRDPRGAVGVIVLLWFAILGTIIEFGRIRPFAALLLVPYLAWVSFAGALNAEIARRNDSA